MYHVVGNRRVDARLKVRSDDASTTYLGWRSSTSGHGIRGGNSFLDAGPLRFLRGHWDMLKLRCRTGLLRVVCVCVWRPSMAFDG